MIGSLGLLSLGEKIACPLLDPHINLLVIHFLWPPTFTWFCTTPLEIGPRSLNLWQGFTTTSRWHQERRELPLLALGDREWSLVDSHQRQKPVPTCVEHNASIRKTSSRVEVCWHPWCSCGPGSAEMAFYTGRPLFPWRPPPGLQDWNDPDSQGGRFRKKSWKRRRTIQRKNFWDPARL